VSGQLHVPAALLP